MKILAKFPQISRAVPALLVLLLGSVAFAGPLLPPAGPITSTSKTLAEVEPRTAISAANTPGDADSVFKISTPGSYYLMANISGVAGKHGIEIAASDVTIDLNGFALIGTPGMGAFDGISVTLPAQSSIVIRGGSVRGWGDKGIDLFTNGPKNCRVENVVSSSNISTGISVGSGSAIIKCSAADNGVTGLSCGTGGLISDSTAYSNTTIGISTSTGCTISGCTVSSNETHGILAQSQCTVIASTATSNRGIGIVVGIGSSVLDCISGANFDSGISCNAYCIIRGNTASSNGPGGSDGAGILATGTNNRIEANSCTGADRGIEVAVGGNFIIKNSCAGNTIDWVLAANNVYGPIIDRSSPATPAVSGKSAASTLGSTDPNANFTY